MKRFLEYFIVVSILSITLLGVWVQKMYGDLTYDQLLFHLNVPLVLTNGLEPSIVWKFVRYCVLPIILAVFIYFVLDRKYFIKHRRVKPIFCSLFIFVLGFLAQKMWHFDELYKQSRVAHTYGDFYEKHYVVPQKSNLIFPNQKRNLIMIVVESMESTFGTSDREEFFRNLTPNLSKIAQENVSFGDFRGGGDITGLWCRLEHCRTDSISLWDSTAIAYWQQ